MRLSWPHAILGVLLGAPVAFAGRQLPMGDFVQEVWDAKEGGLPHPTVATILQTRDGYIWVGTFTGLIRFDGHTFTSEFPETPALDDHIRVLYEAPDGSLWAGTRRSGAIRIRDGHVQQILTTKDGLPSNDVNGFTTTADGTFWILANGVVAVRPDGSMKKYGPDEGITRETFVHLWLDRDGTVWVIGGNYAMAWFEGDTFHHLNWTTPPEGGPQRINDLLRDKDGVLWAATGSGLFRVIGERSTAPRLEKRRPEPATRLLEGRDGLWVASEQGLIEIRRNNEERRYTAADGLLHDVVRSLLEDVEGNLWVGTRTGLARLRPRLVRSYTVQDGLPAALVTAVIETRGGDLWVGTENGVALRHDGKWRTFDPAKLPSPLIRALAEGPDGSIWIGTFSGLARYRDGQFTRWDLGTMVRSITVDAQGDVLAALISRGVFRVAVNGELTLVTARPDLCTSGINTVVPAADGSFYVGGLTSLAHVRNGNVRCDIDAEFPPRNDVRGVLPDDKGAWLATIGGLARIDGEARRSLAWRGGPLRTAVYSMLDDGLGSFWLGTPKGIYQIAREELTTKRPVVAFRPFGIEDGMATGVCTGDGDPAAWKGHDGLLYFTTASGLAVVDPHRVEKLTIPPRVHIDRVIVDNRPLPKGENLRLEPGTRDIQINFVGLSFAAPEGVEYKYRLENYDREWIVAGSRRSAYYASLPPGRYRFRVIAANQNGVWNNEGAFLDFVQLPHFYQRRWFMPLVVATLLAAGVTFYRLRVAALRARQVELQAHVDEAVANIKVLRGLLPICASCKKVRDDSGYWDQIETYIGQHSEAGFSHSVCPDCLVKLYPDYAKAMKETASS
jgi:ligand-binding sensor domain-containing protein